MSKVVLCIFLCFSLVNSANILGYFPTCSISHQVIFQPIWKELSLRGHKVTVITPNPLNDPSLTNLTEIDISYMYGEMSVIINKILALGEMNIYSRLINQFEILRTLEDDTISSKSIQELLKDDNLQFDLVMVEWFHSIGLGFGYKYNAPVIGVSSFFGIPNIHEVMGNPRHPAFMPDIFLGFGERMSFLERVQNTVFNVWYRYFHHWVNVPEWDKIARKHFGNDIPYIGDLEKNISLVLINSNPVLDYVKPSVPGVIEINQMHIKPKKALPKDLKDYLDKSKNGVIYFSLGTNVLSSKTDPEFLNAIKEAISELPYNFMWKWETDDLPNKPKNVLIQKWFPQQDLLDHPNIKAFVTQGGLQSMEEAITNAVPMVVIPYFGDQPYNAKRMVHMEIAKELNYKTLTKEDFKQAVTEVVENDKYKRNVVKYSKLLVDQPMTGLEKAVWWTEFTLRHKGDFNLRGYGADVPYYQYFLLDIIALALIIVLVTILSVKRLVKVIIRILNIRKSSRKLKYN